MADRPQRKIADHSDIAADDPFAELTRIMGFDPREPARERVEPRLVPAEAAVDDFDIDLEKELMGEFAAYEDDAAELPQLAASEIAPPMAQAEPAVASEAAYAEAEAPEFQAEEPFHDEFETVMDDHVAGALEEDFHFEDDFAAAVAQEVPAAPQAALEAEAAAVGEDDIDSHFDAHFERAMTDVDMDFAVEPAQEPAAAIPEPEDEPLAPTVTAEAPAPVAAAAPDSLEDELNALLNRMSAHPVLPELEPETWAEEPVAALAPADAREPASADEANWELDAESARAEAGTVAEHELDSALLADLQAAEFEDEPRLDNDLDAAPEFSAADYPAAEEGASEHEVHFDSDAFDAAMAGEFDIRDEHDEAAPQPAPAAQEEDPVESLKWLTSRPAPEPARAWGRGTPVAPVRPVEPVEQVERPEPVAAFVPQSYEEPQSYQEAATEDYYEPEYEAGPQPAEEEASSSPVAAASDDAPDIETVDVPERVVALADDLDIPELAFEEDHAETPAYDDLDAEFASLLHEMNAAEPAPARVRASTYEDESYSAGFSDQRAYADFSQAAAPSAAVAATVAYAGSDGFPHAGAEASVEDGGPADSDLFAVTDDFDYDPDQDESMASSNVAEAASSRQSRGRGLMLAGIIGAVAVVGGLGALALSFGGKGSTGAPAIVKADNQPIKVKPENPGGTVIPNQDNKVYDMVAKGPKPAAPAQQKLVTQTEEPVDVTAQEPPSRVVDLSGQNGPDSADVEPQAASQAPTAKAEDRIEQMAQDGAETVNAEVPVVAPRKVRTMVVKPDGSLVPREDPAPAQVAAAEPLDPAPQHVAAPGQPEATGTVAVPDDTAAVQSGEAPAAKPAAKTQSSMPAVAPIAPQRPSDQPVNVVGEVKPDQVASIDSGAAAAGTWSMQIASQPTEESAQSTYQDLARRYSSVLQGHSANIVKAEVAGKGTFYRVRVPAKSRNDAIALCTSYKAAGGNCFVSK